MGPSSRHHPSAWLPHRACACSLVVITMLSAIELRVLFIFCVRLDSYRYALAVTDDTELLVDGL
jgi:hypothetical protein